MAKRVLAAAGLLGSARAARMRCSAWAHARRHPRRPEDLRCLYDEAYFRAACYCTDDPAERTIKSAQAELICRTIRPQRVLDCGCAAGELVRAFRRCGVQAWGFDFTPALGEIVYPEVRPFVACGSLTDIPFGPGHRFDAVLAIDVLEHLPARRVRRALAALASLEAPWLVTLINHQDFMPGHVTLRSPAWWERMLRPYFRLVPVPLDTRGLPPVYGVDGDPGQRLRFWHAVRLTAASPGYPAGGGS